MHPATFRARVDAELGPTPPSPADRLEWVVRAAGWTGPPHRGRLPQRGHLVLATVLLCGGLVAVLLVDARLSTSSRSGGPAVGAGDTGRVATGVRPPSTHRPLARLGPATSAPLRGSTAPAGPSIGQTVPGVATVPPRRPARPVHRPPAPSTVRPTGRPVPSGSRPDPPPGTASPTPAPGQSTATPSPSGSQTPVPTGSSAPPTGTGAAGAGLAGIR